MRTIFIGDVHGCLDELEALLRKLGQTEGDELVFVGDLIAKGPDSPGVVRLVRELGAKSVLGNHEELLLRARRGEGPLKPAHEEVAARLDEADWEFLEGLPTRLDVARLGIVVVHAGLVPGVPIDRQRREHLLSVRSFRPDGTPSRKVDDGVPWASRWPGPEHVVFGHDAIRGLQQHPFATGLDTGCVYGRELTALVMPEGRLVSVPAQRKWAEPKSIDA